LLWQQLRQGEFGLAWLAPALFSIIIFSGMPDPTRPDPDALLASLKQAEAKAARGRLKIFFGMAPGVGKTYAMLEAARKAHAEGVDVAVALVETHGREETQRLLEGLPVVPRKLIAYRGTQLARGSFQFRARPGRRPDPAVHGPPAVGRASGLVGDDRPRLPLR